MSEVTTYHELTALRAKVERLEAENARLMAGGCARVQTTTQFCAEAVSLQTEVDRLRGLLLEMHEFPMAYKARQILLAVLGETNEPA